MDTETGNIDNVEDANLLAGNALGVENIDGNKSSLDEVINVPEGLENAVLADKVASVGGGLDLDQSIDIIDVVPVVFCLDTELKNYKFNSSSVLLSDLQIEIQSSNFSRSSLGLRGLVSLDTVSAEDFDGLRMFEIPGVLFDFGQKFSTKDVSRFLSAEEHGHIRGITAVHYSLKRLNDYLELKYASSLIEGGGSSSFLSDRRSLELGSNLYRFNSWIDPGVRCLGPTELSQFLVHCDIGFLRSNIAPWPATLFPKDAHDVKYRSVIRDGIEYVCRTMALRQTDVKFYTESSEIFSCIICGDVISTPYHTFVNCYRFFKDAPFMLIMNWTKTFLRSCYIHFRIEGVELPGRNCHSDSSFGDHSRGWLGRGSSRGRGGRGSSWRRGAPAASLFKP